MKVISNDEFDAGIYKQVDESNDKVILWQNPESGAWWAVVTTSTDEIEGADSVAVAYALDGSERSDNTIRKWAVSAAARALHPEDEDPE